MTSSQKNTRTSSSHIDGRQLRLTRQAYAAWAVLLSGCRETALPHRPTLRRYSPNRATPRIGAAHRVVHPSHGRAATLPATPPLAMPLLSQSCRPLHGHCLSGCATPLMAALLPLLAGLRGLSPGRPLPPPPPSLHPRVWPTLVELRDPSPNRTTPPLFLPLLAGPRGLSPGRLAALPTMPPLLPASSSSPSTISAASEPSAVFDWLAGPIS